jgi:hypothetical protein
MTMPDSTPIALGTLTVTDIDGKTAHFTIYPDPNSSKVGVPATCTIGVGEEGLVGAQAGDVGSCGPGSSSRVVGSRALDIGIGSATIEVTVPTSDLATGATGSGYVWQISGGVVLTEGVLTWSYSGDPISLSDSP